MEYNGKLYGKISGTFFDTGKTTDDYDQLISPEVTVNYAAFCVKCDRENLPIICIKDYINKFKT